MDAEKLQIQGTIHISEDNAQLRFKSATEDQECEVGHNVSINCLGDCVVQKCTHFVYRQRKLIFIEKCAPAQSSSEYDSQVSKLLRDESVLDVQAAAFVLLKRSLFTTSRDVSFNICAYVFAASSKFGLTDANPKTNLVSFCWALKLLDDASKPFSSVTVLCRSTQIGAMLNFVAPSKRYIITNLICSTMNKGQTNESNVFVFTKSSRILEVNECTVTDWRDHVVNLAGLAKMVPSTTDISRDIDEYQEDTWRAKCRFECKINPPFISVLRSFSGRVIDVSSLRIGLLTVELLHSDRDLWQHGSQRITVEMHFNTHISQCPILPFIAIGDVLHCSNFFRVRLTNGMFVVFATVYSTLRLVSTAVSARSFVEISSHRFLLRNVFEKYEITLLEYAAFVEQSYAVSDTFTMPFTVAARALIAFFNAPHSKSRWSLRDESKSAKRIQQFVDGFDTRIHSSTQFTKADLKPVPYQPSCNFFEILTVPRLLDLLGRLSTRFNDLVAAEASGAKGSKFTMTDLVRDEDYLCLDAFSRCDSSNSALSRLVVTLQRAAVCGYLSCCKLTGRLCLASSQTSSQCDSHVHCVVAPFCCDGSEMVDGHALFGKLILVDFGLRVARSRSRLVIDRFSTYCNNNNNGVAIAYAQFAPADCSLVDVCSSELQSTAAATIAGNDSFSLDVRVTQKFASNCDVRANLTARELTRCFKVKVQVLRESVSSLAGGNAVPNASLRYIKAGSSVSLLSKSDCLGWHALLREGDTYRFEFSSVTDLIQSFTMDKIDQSPMFVLSQSARIRVSSLACEPRANRDGHVAFSELVRLFQAPVAATGGKLRYSFVARIAGWSLDRKSHAPPVAQFLSDARPLCVASTENRTVMSQVQCSLYNDYQLQLLLSDRSSSTIPMAGELCALDLSFESDSDGERPVVTNSENQNEKLTLFWIADKHFAQLGLLRNSVVEFRNVLLKQFGAKQHLCFDKASALELLELGMSEEHGRRPCAAAESESVSVANVSSSRRSVLIASRKLDATARQVLQTSEPLWPINDNDDSWMAQLCNNDAARLDQSVLFYAKKRTSLVPQQPQPQPQPEEPPKVRGPPRAIISAIRLRVLERRIDASECFQIVAHVNLVVSLRLKARCDACAAAKLRSDVIVSGNFSRTRSANAPTHSGLDWEGCESTVSCESSCVLMADDGTGCAWITLYDDAVRKFLGLSSKLWTSLRRIVAHTDTFQYRHSEHRLTSETPAVRYYATPPSNAAVFDEMRKYCASYQRSFKHRWFRFTCAVAEQQDDELRRTLGQCSKGVDAASDDDYLQLFKLPNFCCDYLS